MKKLLLVALVLASTGITSPSLGQSAGYVASIETHRAAEEADFRDSSKTPLDSVQLASFSGLNYFPIDEKYRVTAQFTPALMPPIFQMATSTGDPRPYKSHGELRFVLNGSEYVLNVYQAAAKSGADTENEGYLVVPFYDETNGHDSYAGGRYLDLEVPLADSVVLDFNLAYNPYCAYNDLYSCIVPPPENRLQTRVEAGAKKYEVWQVVKAADGSYSVEWPGFPVSQTKSAPSASGSVLTYAQVLDQGGTAFTVAYTPYTESAVQSADPAVLLETVKTTVPASMNGKLVADHTIFYDQYPGIQMTIEIPSAGLVAEWRAYMIGARLYQLVYVHKAEQMDSTVAKRFFGSFQLDSSAAKPQLARLLEEAGFTYNVEDDGDYSFTINFTDVGRNQFVTITPGLSEETANPYYEIWSVVQQKTERPSADQLLDLLQRSGRGEGEYQAFINDDGETLIVLADRVNTTVEADALHKVIVRIASYADNLEKDWTNEDEW